MKNLQNVLLLSVAILSLSACGGDKKQQPGRAAQQGPQPVVATQIPNKTLTAYTNYPANIEGVVNSEVRAKIQGYIDEVLVDEGQQVEKGQPLFRLETQSLSQDAEAAQAQVKAAQVEVDRLKPLVEKEIISPVQLETAKAKLAQAKSNYQSVTANIDYAVIKSPVDGFIGSIRLRQGSLVGPTDQAPLTVVSDISRVYAYFSLNETQYLDFIQRQKGKNFQSKIDSMPRVRLLLPNGSLYPYKGKIETINSQVNSQTGSVFFRAVFDNPERLLTNGNSGTVQIPEVFNNKAVVPVPSTFERQGRKYVYRIVERDSSQGKMLESVVIETAAQVENMYVVKKGIKKGEMIAAKGVAQLRDQTPVKPKPTAFDSIAKPLKQVFR